MKKVILFLVLTTTVASFSHAQSVKLGLRTGANLSNYVGDGTRIFKTAFNTKPTSQFGLHGGLTLNAPLTSGGFLSLQPELLYSQRGFRLEGNGIKHSVREHYIDLPVLARINADGHIFEAGPQIGYLVAATIKEDDNAPGNIVGSYRRTEVGYLAGVGYQFTSGPSVTIRYNGGISAIKGYDTDDSKTRHSVFHFSLGYAFGGE
ncbi:hypothetical protein SAMN00120144_1515 [Hymenobacter roseosalivarius DSM 11622]|uniref:Outer membrane protein beta-barrel domain-containing protein n=1 Tax=Hymenobacter roseosalivarius DSM 11622 TaxID=645990 RepID=A0A1W1V1K3_9BACT|nr:porin family protein [Hymenobacter roseosalivarius]SMB87247.1 hypothetical protein SAMN00120144_1515 [Hymenobacter roseosalivarius DSM 11622]